MKDTNMLTDENNIKLKALDRYLALLESMLEKTVKSNDNFIDVGGHSMIAILLNEKIKNEFSLILSMEKLFNATLNETFIEATYI
ncbi:phosphopantetheine-binding protein [Xenorhabdus ishibashii]|uniref:Non-ribosomal peptide synthetase n=1 Tax=Xenorhabdus ishibashii TaxID=1034471 RepID=A0A2D0KH82_9GAMM|nr:phosphopantetheine-binding protein [Xenorhabdus ishibashii]PHM62786.1 non-ribosomal peptide synthetase [Xenorhabdus ishibashii]